MHVHVSHTRVEVDCFLIFPMLHYRYYFLGYDIVDNWNLTEEQKQLRAMNTFLLALDGDVDFRPEAILKVGLGSVMRLI